jgi:cytochrome P450
MTLLPVSIPRATEIQQFYQEPFGFLARSRSSLGDMFVISDAGSVFSQSPDCTGAVAVFGPAHHRAVLSDIDLFGMPISAAQHLSLPPHVANLNRSLQSMRGKQHDEQQRLLTHVLSERGIEDQRDALSAGLETFLRTWQPGQRIELLCEMRKLALQASTGLLFGERYAESSKLGLMIQDYFQLRREASSPLNPASETLRDDLIALGTSLDDALRRYIHWSRHKTLTSSDGVLTRLASLKLESGRRLSEDALVAHSNILFVSSTEPVAVALTWILLVLSQLPDLRRALRQELDPALFTSAVPPSYQLARLNLLGAVINESLRLFPPNALMVRLTTRTTPLNGVRLPKLCELVLCPFLAHRDADRFERPNSFLPSRWSGTRPSPFEYFPFGAGGHACVGRYLATYMIKTALALLMPRYELVLADDQEIDWRIHIQFMPMDDPLMNVCTPDGSTLSAGKLLGPVSELMSLDNYKA